jgi:hypothetical protein
MRAAGSRLPGGRGVPYHPWGTGVVREYTHKRRLVGWVVDELGAGISIGGEGGSHGVGVVVAREVELYDRGCME